MFMIYNKDLYNREFDNIVGDVLSLDEYQKLKYIKHHGISRYDHSLRVAYYSYLITKIIGLDYKETAVAALLHDFFTDEVEDKWAIERLTKHPEYALANARKNVDLSEKQIDIIKNHMFPVTFSPPKYLESWIVDLVDDVSAIYECGIRVRKNCKVAAAFIYLFLFNFWR